MQKGNISVQTENIFPIIKKFLYSDQEIFLRELIANAVDATTKLKTLANRGNVEGEIGDTHIEILIDNEANTLTIRDRGIGMTEEEVMKYLNQVAFSSAQEFLEKYKGEDGNIIGHFGLGFYSAFMVAKQVDVLTKSYSDAPAVKWSCTGDPEYTLEAIDKDFRGTDIVLHIDEDSKEYLEESRIKELLKKYCKFLPVEIRYSEEAVNNTNPAWRKQPTELTDEDYTSFYEELYPYSRAPLFWIHLNIDFPFNLTGILYFPKLTNNLEIQKNKIQLYSNQMYVTDEVKEIVPEFLTLLHGVIDSPDIPLNVSRSYLQSDRNVKKITSYITRKVADKLHDLFKNDRESYEAKWKDIGTFIKYGMITDDKFADKAKSFVLLQDVEGKYATIEDYKEQIKDAQTDKDGKLVLLYTNNPIDHDSFIKSAKSYGYSILEFDNVLDSHFIQHIEYKLGENLTFKRVDADTVNKLIDKDEKLESVLSDDVQEEVKKMFESQVNASVATVQLSALSPQDMPVLITKSEFMRRMHEMSRLQGTDFSGMSETYNVVVNSNHPLITDNLLALEGEEEKNAFVKHLYNLALLNQNMLKGAELTAFVSKSLEMLK
jgi:molecular chaperone HtpG